MTPSTIQGPQGTLVAFRNNSGKVKGLPLVFVHADPGRATQWEAVMMLMAKTHDMTALDFRGSGACAPPPPMAITATLGAPLTSQRWWLRSTY